MRNTSPTTRTRRPAPRPDRAAVKMALRVGAWDSVRPLADRIARLNLG